MDRLKQYSSDSEEELEEEQSSQLPDVPSEILDKFHKAPSLPEDFYMFKRLVSIPPGYYNSFCSLEFTPSRPQLEILSDVYTNLQMVAKMSPLFRELNMNFQPLYQTKTTGLAEELHVSLTGNIFLTKPSKEKFKSMLRYRLQNNCQCPSPDGNVVRFRKLSLMKNSDHTRVFAVLELTQETRQQIKPVYETIMDSLKDVQRENLESVKLHQEWLVNPDNLHVSIADCITHRTSITEDQWVQLNDTLAMLQIDPLLELKYDSVKMADGTSRSSFKVGDYRL